MRCQGLLMRKGLWIFIGLWLGFVALAFGTGNPGDYIQVGDGYLGTAAIRDAEDVLTDGSNLPDGAAIKAYGDEHWSMPYPEAGVVVSTGDAWGDSLTIGTDLQAYSDYLQQIADSSPLNGDILIGQSIDGSWQQVAGVFDDATNHRLKHESGGLEADVSAYDGLIKISGGVTSNVSAIDIIGDLSLTEGYLPVASDASGLVDSPIYTDGTAIGIGTAGPWIDDERIHAYHDDGPVVVKAESGVNNTVTLNLTNWIGGLEKTSLLQRTGLDYFRIFHAGDNRISIDPTGNVGIGTATPDYTLDVAGTMGIDQYLYHNGDADTFLNFEDDLVRVQVGGEYLLDLYEGAQDYVKLGDGGDVDINLNDDVFVEGSSGNVGVGTTSPDKKLEINTGASDNGIRISYNDADGSATNYCDYIVGADGDLTITTVDAGAAAEGDILLMPDGKVGINDTDPNQLLGMYGTNAQISIEESDTEFLRVGVGETAGTSIIGWDDSDKLYLGVYASPTDTTIDPKVVIDSDGKVGIGATSPGTLLEVAEESADAEITISAYHNTEATSPRLTMRKADNTEASPAAVDDDAVLGTINFKGHDGDSWETGASIVAKVAGAPGNADIPTEMIFSTTPDGSATPVERLFLKPTGLLRDSHIPGLSYKNHTYTLPSSLSLGLGTSGSSETTNIPVIHAEKYTAYDATTNAYEAAAQFSIKKTAGFSRPSGVRGFAEIAGGSSYGADQSEVHGIHGHAKSSAADASILGIWGGFTSTEVTGGKPAYTIGFEVDLNNITNASHKTTSLGSPLSIGYVAVPQGSIAHDFAYFAQASSGTWNTGLMIAPDSITPGCEAIYISGGSNTSHDYAGIVFGSGTYNKYFTTGIDMSGAVIATGDAIYIPNNAGIKTKTTGATKVNLAYMNNSNDFVFGGGDYNAYLGWADSTHYALSKNGNFTVTHDLTVNGNISGDGATVVNGVSKKVLTKSSSYTLTIEDSGCLLYTTDDAVITLPDPVSPYGQEYTIVNNHGNYLSIAPADEDTIYSTVGVISWVGAEDDVIRSTTAYESITVVSISGASWFVTSLVGSSWVEVP